MSCALLTMHRISSAIDTHDADACNDCYQHCDG
jgi:hypothetical protein